MNLTFSSLLKPSDLEEWLGHNAKAVASCPALKPKTKTGSLKNRGFLYWVLILTIAVVLFVLMHWLNGPAPAPAAPAPTPAEDRSAFKAILWNILPYVIIGVLVWFFFLRALSKRYRAKMIWEQFHEFQQPRTIHAADDGLIITMPTVENRISWPHFIHFYETPNLFLLYNSSRAAHLFPKRDFPDAAALDSFRQLCQSHISRMPTAFPIEPHPTAAAPPAS